MRSSFAASARSTSSAWDLLLAITLRDLRVKYHGTFLSYFWWIAKPLTLGLVMYFALGRVLKIDIPHHAVFLLASLFPWFWFSGSLGTATNSFVANNGLVKKVQFPRAIVPISVVLGSSFEFIAALPVLMIFVFASGIEPTWAWLVGIPLLFVVQFALLAGLGTLFATVNVFFRDLAPSLDAILTLLFYISPIIYPLSKVPENIRPFMKLNPMVSLLDGWRSVFVDGEFPGLDIWPAVLFAVVSVAVGGWVLNAIGKNMADAL